MCEGISLSTSQMPSPILTPLWLQLLASCSVLENHQAPQACEEGLVEPWELG